MENSKEKIHSVVSQIIFLIALLIIWEITAKAHLFGNSSELVFPPLEKIAEAFVNNFKYGYAGTSFWVYILNSMKLLLLGLVIGILLSILFSSFAIVCKTFHYIYNSIVSICDLLPGIALLPIIIIIFGIKPSVIVFLVIHAEMIFGIVSCPGIGLYINQMRTNMKNAEMYATLIVIIMIGVIVQYGILAPIEKYTVKSWGMTK